MCFSIYLLIDTICLISFFGTGIVTTKEVVENLHFTSMNLIYIEYTVKLR